MRKLTNKQLAGTPVSIYFDAEYGEYQVRVQDKPSATSYTDDKQDAIDTALWMLANGDLTPDAVPDDVLARDGDYDITGDIAQDCTLYFNHVDGDETVGSGSLVIEDNALVDYDGVYELPHSVIKGLQKLDIDTEYAEV